MVYRLRTRRMIAVAIVFEASLGLIGWVVAWWAGVALRDRLDGSAMDVARGLLATLPLLAMLFAALWVRWRPMADLVRQVRRMVAEFFGEASAVQLLAVAVAAGVGEEVLFRGALQPLAIRWLGVGAGIVATSVLFGAVHAASVLYFALATLVGLYLGWLTEQFDDLAAPIVVHAAYDFIALVILARPAKRLTASDEVGDTSRHAVDEGP